MAALERDDDAALGGPLLRSKCTHDDVSRDGHDAAAYSVDDRDKSASVRERVRAREHGSH